MPGRGGIHRKETVQFLGSIAEPHIEHVQHGSREDPQRHVIVELA
jgi:hypothetical protein